MKEIRKDIIWYKWAYQVSNIGRIKSLKFWKKQILKNQFRNRWKWYRWIRLTKNNIWKNYDIHRLVALAFIEKIKNKSLVCHRDNNWLNNIYTNLYRWTHSENNKYAYVCWRTAPSFWKFLSESNRAVSINQYTLDWIFIKTRWCMKEASEKLNIQKTSISACCRGIYKTAGWYLRQYFIL